MPRIILHAGRAFKGFLVQNGVGYTFRMSESAELPMNFGGIEDEALSSFERAPGVVWPVSYEGTGSYGTGTGAGPLAGIDAPRNMEPHGEETDAEVHRLRIH